VFLQGVDENARLPLVPAPQLGQEPTAGQEPTSVLQSLADASAQKSDHACKVRHQNCYENCPTAILYVSVLHLPCTSSTTCYCTLSAILVSSAKACTVDLDYYKTLN
jgi:hypothetical protein